MVSFRTLYTLFLSVSLLTVNLPEAFAGQDGYDSHDTSVVQDDELREKIRLLLLSSQRNENWDRVPSLDEIREAQELNRRNIEAIALRIEELEMDLENPESHLLGELDPITP